MKPKILTIFPYPAEPDEMSRRALTERASSSRNERVQPATESVTLPSIESLILRKLLAEAEARKIEQVRPPIVLEQRPARPLKPVHALLGLLWLASIAVAVLAVKYVDNQTMVPKSGDTQSKSIEALSASIAHQNEVFAMVIGSMQQLTGTVATSAKRAEALPAILARLGNQLQQSRETRVAPVPELASQPTIPVVLGTLPRKSDSAPIPMGGHIHPPIEWAVAPPNVVVHHNSAGTIDYWLVPRTLAGVPKMVKVVPIVQNSSGTFVHDVTEVKDYTLTPSGDWIESPEPASTR